MPLLTIPLTATDRQFVKRIAMQSRCPQSRLQKLIPNLLAVRAVSHWLDIYGIAYDWQQSYCVNSLIHLGDEVADLYLPGLGRLECRAIAPGEATVTFPAEVWTDRLGYCVVEVAEDLQGGRLVGFLEAVQRETLTRRNLQPFDTLFGVLAAAESRVLVSTPDTVSTTLNAVASTIQRWIDSAVAQAWQVGEFLVLEPNFAPARGTSTVENVMAKLRRATSDAAQQRLIITLGELARDDNQSPVIEELVAIINETQNDDTRWLAAATLARLEPQHPLAAHCLKKVIGANFTIEGTPLELMISLMPHRERDIAGIIELRAAEAQRPLPVGLTLSLLSETNDVIDEIIITADPVIPKTLLKMTLEIEPGTDFRVRVSLGDVSVVEDVHL